MILFSNLKVTSPCSADCEAICALLIESITVNCAADYNHDPAIMDEWLANKTPENISTWINSSNNISLIAYDTLKNKVVGFILMDKNGEILLNYVLPSHLHQGIGKFLLQEMEKEAQIAGLNVLLVVSTITAKEFYERNGFVKNGEPEYVGTILGDFPLIKYLKI